MKNELLLNEIKDIRYPLNLKPGSTIVVSSRYPVGKSTFVEQVLNEILERDKDYEVLHLDLEISFSTKRKHQLISSNNIDRYSILNYHSTFLKEHAGSEPVYIKPADDDYNENYLQKLKQILSEGSNRIIVIDNIALISAEMILEHLVPISKMIKETNNILILISPQIATIDTNYGINFKQPHKNIMYDVIDHEIFLSAIDNTVINVISTEQNESTSYNIEWNDLTREFDKNSIKRL